MTIINEVVKNVRKVTATVRAEEKGKEAKKSRAK